MSYEEFELPKEGSMIVGLTYPNFNEIAGTNLSKVNTAAIKKLIEERDELYTKLQFILESIKENYNELC